MESMREWLESRGLGEHAEAFEANDIGIDVLVELIDVDLAAMGLSLGHRRRLLKAIALAARPSPEQAGTAGGGRAGAGDCCGSSACSGGGGAAFP